MDVTYRDTLLTTQSCEVFETEDLSDKAELSLEKKMTASVASSRGADATSATASTISQPIKLSFADGVEGSSESSTGRRRTAKPEGKVTTTSLTENNVLNQSYSDSFYKSMLAYSLEDLNKLMYYNDIPVGAILCRMKDTTLEVLALVILAPYRSLGLGSTLLNTVLDTAATTSAPDKAATKSEPAVPGRVKATRAILHVQDGNDDAKQFYVNKGGFAVVEKVEDYYRNRTPKAAWVLEKKLD